MDLEMGRIIGALRAAQRGSGKKCAISSKVLLDLRAKGAPVPDNLSQDGGGTLARCAAPILGRQLLGIENGVHFVEK